MYVCMHEPNSITVMEFHYISDSVIYGILEFHYFHILVISRIQLFLLGHYIAVMEFITYVMDFHFINYGNGIFM